MSDSVAARLLDRRVVQWRPNDCTPERFVRIVALSYEPCACACTLRGALFSVVFSASVSLIPGGRTEVSCFSRRFLQVAANFPWALKPFCVSLDPDQPLTSEQERELEASYDR